MGSVDSLAVIYSSDFLLHDTGGAHPERPDRVKAVSEALKKAPFQDRLVWHKPRSTEAKWVESIHTPAYRQFIEESALSGKSTVDSGETLISHDSYEVALLAVGGAMQAVDLVMQGGFSRAFLCGRPPGHHARSEQAMGFCLFNNIAIAARYAQLNYGIQRVCIFDFDVHHGNGTQESFYNDPSILFCSIHQLPLYPHTGEFYETGNAKGKNFNINSPINANSTIIDFRKAWEDDFKEAIESFDPQLLLISAGFDAHHSDPLAQVNLNPSDFYEITNNLVQVAKDHCNGKVVSILEGGYDLDGLAKSATAHVNSLLEIPFEEPV